MTEIVRKRSSKWDVVPEISIPTGGEQDSNNHCEKTGDNNHEKNSNLELIDSNNSTGGAIKWSNVGPTDTVVSKDSGWSNWDLGNENRDGGNISSTMKTWGGETSIPTGDQQDVNNHCEKTGDAKHENISNLELIDSKNSASEAINLSNVGPKNTEASKDSGLSNLDLGNENRDGGDISSTMKTWGEETSIPTGDQQVDNSHCEKTGDTMHDKHSNLELSDSKHSTSEAMKWSNVGPKDTTVSKDSGWSNWDVGNENRGGGDISSTMKTWGGDQRSISPGPDSWSRSRSRSPKREWSRSHRSRSPSHSWNRDKDGWKDRSRRGSQETYGHDGGRRSNSGPIEIRGGRQERGGPVGHIDDDIPADFQRQGGYSGDRPFHGERKRQEPERESNNPCFDFRKGKCFRGSACRYVHDSSSTDGYSDKVARERAHDRHDPALPSENRRRHSSRGLPPCKFFPQGQCRNGASCPFPHLAPGNESQWGLRPDNGNNLEGVQNRRWQDASMENAPRSPKWRYDASRRVGTHDSNRDHHSSYMDREGSRQIQEDLPPWNPPQTYHTLPNKPPEFPIPTGKQDTSRGFPDPHQLVSNYNTVMTVNSGGINSSASNLPSMATGPTPNFNLNEQSQQMGSQVPSNPQFTMQMDMGRAITKPDVSDPNSIHITAAAAIAQNLVTSEQVSQVKNISASLAQIIATGQQLPQLYASLNPPPAPGFMPSHAFSHPNFTRPLTPMGAELVQTNTGIWPQSKPYDSVSDNIKSGNPPGFALGLAVQQNASTEESLKPIKSLDLFPETGGFDYDPKKIFETEEKGNYMNENHERVQPEMNRDTGAKEINEVGGDGAMEQETGLSKETGQLEDESVKGKEAKAMRMFKFALVEFVKEMLKPTWREGQMSKEAHKTIVKKVVDKVTGALQGPQVPQTQEKIDQYLMFSKAKLEKLVQAYVEKYLKI